MRNALNVSRMPQGVLMLALPVLRAHDGRLQIGKRCAGQQPIDVEINARRGGRVAGSAPRVRGTPRTSRDARPERRFSPACAENAIAERPHPAGIAVQPRVCGERCVGVYLYARSNGSAPRVRGTRYTVKNEDDIIRFSPACAGNACFSENARPASAVQPRVCGERALGYIKR